MRKSCFTGWSGLSGELGHCEPGWSQRTGNTTAREHNTSTEMKKDAKKNREREKRSERGGRTAHGVTIWEEKEHEKGIMKKLLDK